MKKSRYNVIAKTFKDVCERHQVDYRGFDFEHTYRNEEEYKIVDKKDRDIYFQVTKPNGIRIVEFYPGLQEESHKVGVGDFRTALQWIPQWIQVLAYEINEPNLWEEFARSQPDSFLESTDNELLTDEEQTKALKAIEDVKAQILSLENSSQETKEELKIYLDDKFAHLEEATTREDRPRKKDYVLMFQATVFNAIAGWVFSPENRNAIWLFAMEQIRIQLIPDINISTLPN